MLINHSDIVLVYDRDEQHLVTSTMAIPTYRVDAPDQTEFTFYENSPEQPEALHTWFHPQQLPPEFRKCRGKASHSVPEVLEVDIMLRVDQFEVNGGVTLALAGVLDALGATELTRAIADLQSRKTILTPELMPTALRRSGWHDLSHCRRASRHSTGQYSGLHPHRCCMKVWH